MERTSLMSAVEIGSTAMNWETFYLVCFLAGLMLSLVSLLGGMGHFGGHVHVPHVRGMFHICRMACSCGGTSRHRGGGADVPWWNAFRS